MAKKLAKSGALTIFAFFVFEIWFFCGNRT